MRPSLERNGLNQHLQNIYFSFIFDVPDADDNDEGNEGDEEGQWEEDGRAEASAQRTRTAYSAI